MALNMPVARRTVAKYRAPNGIEVCTQGLQGTHFNKRLLEVYIWQRSHSGIVPKMRQLIDDCWVLHNEYYQQFDSLYHLVMNI